MNEHNRGKLRSLLNDKLPLGGTESEVVFTAQEVDEMLSSASNIFYAAAVGWTMKGALLQSKIESYTIGEEKYDTTKLKDEIDHALRMSKQYHSLAVSAEDFKNPKKPTSFMLKVQRPEVL